MPIYREIISFKNANELNDLFEELPPSEIVEKIALINLYFLDENLYKISDRSFEENLNVWESILNLTDSMISKTDGDEVMYLKDGKAINLAPLYDFLDELGSLRDFIDDLEEIERTLQLFLYAGNIDNYKQCRDTVSSFTRFMRRIEDRIGY